MLDLAPSELRLSRKFFSNSLEAKDSQFPEFPMFVSLWIRVVSMFTSPQSQGMFQDLVDHLPADTWVIFRDYEAGEQERGKGRKGYRKGKRKGPGRVERGRTLRRFCGGKRKRMEKRGMLMCTGSPKGYIYAELWQLTSLPNQLDSSVCSRCQGPKPATESLRNCRAVPKDFLD